MIHAVIDTNVLVSAMFARHDTSPTVIILGKVFASEITPLYNEEILAEYQDVLLRNKFHFNTNKVTQLINYIRLVGINTQRTPYFQPMQDEKDRVFYEVSLSQEDSFLVTGNLKHFPVTPQVVSPAEMLEILLRQ